MQWRWEDRAWIGGLFVVVVWTFAALPLLSSWNASQFARQPEYSNQNNGQSKSNKSLWERTTEDPTAFFTAWVAAFTCILAVSTIGLWIVTWRSSVKQSRDMAESIKAAQRNTDIAERALTELERPYLFILDFNWLLVEEAKTDGGESGFSYSVMNGGKLPASIKAVKFGMRFGTSIPPVVDEPHVHQLLTAPLIAGGEKRMGLHWR